MRGPVDFHAHLIDPAVYSETQRWSVFAQTTDATRSASVNARMADIDERDAYPKLKIVVSHGGGYMPSYLGRIARNYAEKPATRVNMSKAPVDYLRMLHYDTCVYDPDTLAHLVATVGAERIVMGSDYPVGEMKPVDFVRDCAPLDASGREMVLAGNARRLLKL